MYALTNDWEILTEQGWKNFNGIRQTEILSTLKIKTISGKQITVSREHLFFDLLNRPIFAQDLKSGSIIITKQGYDVVEYIESSDDQVLYDVLNSDSSTFFAEDILSHNSTTLELFICHFMLFNKHKQIALISKDYEASLDLLRKIKNAYQAIPKWLQQGVLKFNEKKLQLENGCSIVCSAPTNSSIRGKTIHLLVIDEHAFIKSDTWDEFYRSTYPTISASRKSKMIIISTPNGKNQFYRFWEEAGQITEEGHSVNGFKRLEIKWNDVPLIVDEFGKVLRYRDNDWKKEQLEKMTEVDFNQEFGGEFLNIGYSLLTPEAFQKLIIKRPLSEIPDELKDLDARVLPHLKLYGYVQKDKKYSLGIDGAKITETSDGDNLAIQVIEISSLPFQQVATVLIKKGIHYLEMTSIIYKIATYFNSAYVFSENNDTAGQEIVNNLHQLFSYDNIYFEKPEHAGFRTTSRTKTRGLMNIKLLIETDSLKIYDKDTIEQFGTLVKKKGSYKAENGCHDDAIFGLLSSLFFMQDEQFIMDKEILLNNIFSKDSINRREENEEIVTLLSNIYFNGQPLVPFRGESENDIDSDDWDFLYS